MATLTLSPALVILFMVAKLRDATWRSRWLIGGFMTIWSIGWFSGIIGAAIRSINDYSST
jgi:hypothetical protein